MKKVIRLTVILLLLLVMVEPVLSNQREIRKIVTDYWSAIRENNLKEALKHYSVFYYMKRVYQTEINKIAVADKVELIQLLNKMQLQNLKNLSRNLLKPGTDAKIDIRSISAIKNVATCNMNLSYTVGTQRFDVELSHYMSKINGQWKICDFMINKKWDSETMKELVRNLSLDDFIKVMREYFSNKVEFKTYKSKDQDVSIDIPSTFVPVASLTGQKADFGDVLLAFERNYLGILVIRSSQRGEFKIDSLADKLRSNVIVSGSGIISDEFYEVNGTRIFTLSSYRVDRNMPGNFAFTDFTFLISGDEFYTIIINSPDHWALKLFSYHKDRILESFKILKSVK